MSRRSIPVDTLIQLTVRSRHADAKTAVSFGFCIQSDPRLCGVFIAKTHYRQTHHIMLVSGKLADARPVLVPVPGFDG